jgi:hypothetical protein
VRRAVGQDTGAATEGREVAPHGGHVVQPHTVPTAPWQEVPFQSWLFHGKQAEKTTARLRQRPTALSSARLAYGESTRVLSRRLWSRTRLRRYLRYSRCPRRGEVAAHSPHAVRAAAHRRCMSAQCSARKAQPVAPGMAAAVGNEVGVRDVGAADGVRDVGVAVVGAAVGVAAPTIAWAMRDLRALGARTVRMGRCR